MPLVLLLVAALVIVVGVLAVRRRTAHRSTNGRRSLSLGRAAVLVLAGGILLALLGLMATLIIGGPEMRGGDKTTGHVLGWLFGLGVFATMLGAVLGVVALVVRRDSARK